MSRNTKNNMFSGIIQAQEKPVTFKRKRQSITASFLVPKGWKITTGESVCIDGICSTVSSCDKKSFTVYWMPETIDKTHLAMVSDAHSFNVEQSLTLQSFIGGHMVSGHVDTTAEVKKIQPIAESKVLTFSLDPVYTRYMITKGSVTVNGVSLTIVATGDDWFSVSLIPFTLQETNLGVVSLGDVVTIEVDLMAKYIEKLTQSYGTRNGK